MICINYITTFEKTNKATNTITTCIQGKKITHSSLISAQATPPQLALQRLADYQACLGVERAQAKKNPTSAHPAGKCPPLTQQANATPPHAVCKSAAGPSSTFLPWIATHLSKSVWLQGWSHLSQQKSFLSDLSSEVQRQVYRVKNLKGSCVPLYCGLSAFLEHGK